MVFCGRTAAALLPLARLTRLCVDWCLDGCRRDDNACGESDEGRKGAHVSENGLDVGVLCSDAIAGRTQATWRDTRDTPTSGLAEQ
jgi:hypothetical protein